MAEVRGHHMQYKAKDAYGSDNKKLGRIMETDDTYFLVQQGLLFSRHYYLPTHLLVGSDADRAFLAVPHDEAMMLAREELPMMGDVWYGPAEDDAVIAPVAPAEQPVIAPAVSG